MDKFPYICIDKITNQEFVPTIIDYDNRQCWHQKSQVSDDDGWVDFADVLIRPNPRYIDITTIEHI